MRVLCALVSDRPLGKNKDLKTQRELEQAEAKFQALQVELQRRIEEKARDLGELKAAEMKRDELRTRLVQEEAIGISVEADYSRLFKSRQEQMIDEVNKLEEEAAELRTKIEITQFETKEIREKKDYDISVKQKKVDDLQTVMNKMANEFDDMMQSILEKFSQEMPIAVIPKKLLDAGVPIDEELRELNAEMQGLKLPPATRSATEQPTSLENLGESKSSLSRGQTTSLPSVS